MRKHCCRNILVFVLIPSLPAESTNFGIQQVQKDQSNTPSEANKPVFRKIPSCRFYVYCKRDNFETRNFLLCLCFQSFRKVGYYDESCMEKPK